MFSQRRYALSVLIAVPSLRHMAVRYRTNEQSAADTRVDVDDEARRRAGAESRWKVGRVFPRRARLR